MEKMLSLSLSYDLIINIGSFLDFETYNALHVANKKINKLMYRYDITNLSRILSDNKRIYNINISKFNNNELKEKLIFVSYTKKINMAGILQIEYKGMSKIHYNFKLLTKIINNNILLKSIIKYGDIVRNVFYTDAIRTVDEAIWNNNKAYLTLGQHDIGHIPFEFKRITDFPLYYWREAFNERGYICVGNFNKQEALDNIITFNKHTFATYFTYNAIQYAILFLSNYDMEHTYDTVKEHIHKDSIYKQLPGFWGKKYDYRFHKLIERMSSEYSKQIKKWRRQHDIKYSNIIWT